jgi:cell division protease FtsH
VPGALTSATNGTQPNGFGTNGNGQPYGGQPGDNTGGTSQDGPPYYGAPPGWTPATTPPGQSWSSPWDRPGGVQDAVPGQPGASDEEQPRYGVDTDNRD